MENVFPERLKQARTDAGMTQANLAAECGLAYASISAYEKGQKTPNVTTAAAIAKALKVSLDWLMGLAANKRGASIAPVETMRDLFEAALRITGKSKNVTISSGECTHAEAQNIHKRPMEEYESYMSEISYSEITIWEDEKTNSFFDEWSALRTLYIKEVIPEDIYFLWVEKKLEEFEKIPSPTVKAPEEPPF